jgi:poly(beta-D-mannuronate) lyase
MQSLFRITGKGILHISGLDINGAEVRATNFISNDTAGSVEHYGLEMRHSRFRNFSADKGCRNIVFAYKSSVADSMVIRNNSFSNNHTNAFVFNDERDDKGYYSVEKLTISDNRFLQSTGILLQLYRGGTDESTLGPELLFEKNTIEDRLAGHEALMELTGAQKTRISGNLFLNSGTPGSLMKYKDVVRAQHLLINNRFLQCGAIQKNEFVRETKNTWR